MFRPFMLALSAIITPVSSQASVTINAVTYHEVQGEIAFHYNPTSIGPDSSITISAAVSNHFPDNGGPPIYFNDFSVAEHSLTGIRNMTFYQYDFIPSAQTFPATIYPGQTQYLELGDLAADESIPPGTEFNIELQGTLTGDNLIGVSTLESIPVTIVPLPTSALLLLSGLFGLFQIPRIV